MSRVLVAVAKILGVVVAFSVIEELYAQVIEGGIRSIRPHIFTRPVTRVVTVVGDVVMRSLSAVLKIILAVLETVLQVPLTLAWATIPGLDSVADEPKVRTLFSPVYQALTP